MKTFTRSLLLSGAVLALAASTSGCGDKLNCASICDDYRECGERNRPGIGQEVWNTWEDNCQELCETRADQSDALSDAASDCQSCLDDLDIQQACAPNDTAAFPCQAVCQGFVPDLPEAPTDETPLPPDDDDDNGDTGI